MVSIYMEIQTYYREATLKKVFFGFLTLYVFTKVR